MGEWFSASALREANETAVEESDREQITGYLYAHPEQFNLRLIPVPPELDRDDVRLTIDGEEDWEHTQTIFERWIRNTSIISESRCCSIISPRCNAWRRSIARRKSCETAQSEKSLNSLAVAAR